MSEIEQVPMEKEEKEQKPPFMKKFIDFVKKHMNTLILCVVAFLVGYFMTNMKSCPVVLDDDFNSGGGTD